MEPLEFEKELKEKLSEREVAVSENAWERLSKQLDIEEGQDGKNRMNFKYIVVAASFIGVLLMTVFYTNTQGIIEPKVVDAQLPLKTPNEERKPAQKVIRPNLVVQEAPLVVSQTKPPKISKTEEVVVKKKTQPMLTKVEASSIATTAIAATTTAQETQQQVVWSDSLIEAKATKLVAVVAQLEQEKDDVTETEIDALLVQAQQEILTQKYRKQYHQNYQAVDATALLLDVEADLDQSFKEQVFEALKTSFNKVRTAMGR